MRRIFLVLSLELAMCFSGISRSRDYVSYVNTLQGSYNTPDFSHGRTVPYVGYPNGVNFWYPVGFSYVRGEMKGLGSDFICLSPEVLEQGDVQSPVSEFVAGSLDGRPDCFKVEFSNGVLSALTATERCAVFSFSYPSSGSPALLVSGGGKSQFDVDAGKRRIEGHIVTESPTWHVSDDYYVTIEFDRAPVYVSETAEGALRVGFTAGESVEVRVAASKISPEQAELNFSRELGNSGFQEIETRTREVWNAALGKIEVEGGTDGQVRTFYSCLYRTMLFPRRSYEYDVHGNPCFAYDRKIYDGKYHVNPILWDAYRSLFPLHNIINIEEQKDYVQSLMKTKEIAGWWPSGHVMIGNHAMSVLADAWVKGIRTFDPEKALSYYYDEVTRSVLDTMVNGAYNLEHLRGYGRMGHEHYFAAGYIPYSQNTDAVMETTSKTIEYCYDDFCAYRLAEASGSDFYRNLFARHLFNYRHVFDPSDGFFKGRDLSGCFDTDFNPYEWGGPFVEGNGWQWRFSVQQDPQGMMDLMGGEDKFTENLDELFEARSDSVLCGGYGYMIHEINEAVAGGQGQYAQGNEPCFHVMHLYNYAGQPWKAQKLLRKSMERLFDSSPKGFPGDEDGGAMSSWYVFNAMGFYPVTPGVGQYVLGSPLFDRITINLESGRKFVIETKGNSQKNVYVRCVLLNGKKYDKTWISHDVIVSGGKLVMQMGSNPDKVRGTSAVSRPYSLSGTLQQ